MTVIKRARDWYAEGFRIVEIQFIKEGAELVISYVEDEESFRIEKVERLDNWVCVFLEGQPSKRCYLPKQRFWIRQEW